MALRKFGVAVCALVLLAACVDVSEACHLPAKADGFVTASAYCYALATKVTKNVAKRAASRFRRDKFDSKDVECGSTADVLALSYFKVQHGGLALESSSDCTVVCNRYAEAFKEYVATESSARSLQENKQLVLAGGLIAKCQDTAWVAATFEVAAPVKAVHVEVPVEPQRVAITDEDDEEEDVEVPPKVPEEIREQIQKLQAHLEKQEQDNLDLRRQLEEARTAQSSRESGSESGSGIPEAPSMIPEAPSMIPEAPLMIPEAPLMDETSSFIPPAPGPPTFKKTYRESNPLPLKKTDDSAETRGAASSLQSNIFDELRQVAARRANGGKIKDTGSSPSTETASTESPQERPRRVVHSKSPGTGNFALDMTNHPLFKKAQQQRKVTEIVEE